MNYLIVPDQKVDESISSFILRLTIENLYERCKWVYDDIGLVSSHKVNHPYNCNMSHSSIKKLALRTNKNIESILNMTFLNEFGAYNDSEDFMDITLGRNIHRLNIKFCSECLKEERYFKKIWALRQYIVCHKHHCLLINRCSNCQMIFNTKSLYDFNCHRCKYPFSLMKVNFISDNLDVANFIFNKMYGMCA